MKLKSIMWVMFFLAGAMLISSTTIYAEKKISLRLCSSTTPGTTIEMTADRFKELVEKRSNGSIEIIRYGAGELYRDREALAALSEGVIEMAYPTGAYCGTRSRALEFISMMGSMGLWDDVEHFNRFLDNPEVQKIASDEFREKFNAKLLLPTHYGGGIVASRKPIHSVEELKGIKIRTPGGALSTVYKALGAAPVEISSSEIYPALQRGIVDAVDTGVARILKAKMYEVAPYVIENDIVPDMLFYLIINKKVWESLPTEYQKILQDVANELGPWALNISKNETEQSTRELKGKKELKEIFIFPEEERAKIVKIVTPVMNEYVLNVVGQEMGTKLLELLESAR
jgi:TRAP-type C4-dicarboxylate transport system substrate-binding protein